jgi:hypothetical protein
MKHETQLPNVKHKHTHNATTTKEICESNIQFVVGIDCHVQWFVDPIFQQIGGIGNNSKLTNLASTHPNKWVGLGTPTNQLYIYIYI